MEYRAWLDFARRCRIAHLSPDPVEIACVAEASNACSARVEPVEHAASLRALLSLKGAQRPNLVVVSGVKPPAVVTLITELKTSADTRPVPILVVGDSFDSAQVDSLYEAGAACVLRHEAGPQEFSRLAAAALSFWTAFAVLPNCDTEHGIGSAG